MTEQRRQAAGISEINLVPTTVGHSKYRMLGFDKQQKKFYFFSADTGFLGHYDIEYIGVGPSY